MGIKYNRETKNYFVTYYRRNPVTKKKITMKRQGIATRAKAEKTYKKLILLVEDKINEAIFPYWPQVVDGFLLSFRNKGVARNTLINYETTLKAHTYVKWEKKFINKITMVEIRDLILVDMQKYSESHKKSMLKHIRAVFQFALDSNMILRDPTPRLKFKVGEKIKLVLKENEIQSLLKKARDKENRWFPIWALACFTGMRNGELFALSWSKVDLSKRVMLIDCSWTKENGFKETKSGDDRIVEIAESLMPVMYNLFQKRKDNFVLPRVQGWETGEQAKYLKIFLAELNLPVIRFHDLRASWATIMLSKGVEPIKIMSMGGWKDLKTMQIYIRKSGIHIKGITNALKFL
ncbi:MAG: site-specific integrase [Halobacteriovoraceae bacterium]|jgi:integrase|nr:site-specific integrase [Halobacteriovoraceae bacterium]